MRTLFKDAITEQDNQTFCAIRIMGFIGLGVVGVALFVGAAPFEAGAGVAAIIASVGGGIRLKGDGKLELTDTH